MGAAAVEFIDPREPIAVTLSLSLMLILLPTLSMIVFFLRKGKQC